MSKTNRGGDEWTRAAFPDLKLSLILFNAALKKETKKKKEKKRDNQSYLMFSLKDPFLLWRFLSLVDRSLPSSFYFFFAVYYPIKLYPREKNRIIGMRNSSCPNYFRQIF